MERLIVTPDPHHLAAGRFIVTLESDGRQVLPCSTWQPLVDGCHALLASGFDPATLITMRHAGAPHDSFRPLPLADWAAMREPSTLQELGHAPTPVLKAIRRKCLDCSGGSPAEVAGCLVRDCALFPFRMGKNPWRAPPSEAQMAHARKTLAKAKPSPSSRGFGATAGVAATTLPAGPEIASMVGGRHDNEVVHSVGRPA